MRHVKLFEIFSSGISSPKEEDGTYIELEFKVTNPDIEYNGIAIGVSKDPLEAAAFCLSAAWKFIVYGKDSEVYDSQEAYDILMNDMFTSKEKALSHLNKIKSGIFPENMFGWSEGECKVRKMKLYGGEGYGYSGESYPKVTWNKIR